MIRIVYLFAALAIGTTATLSQPAQAQDPQAPEVQTLDISPAPSALLADEAPDLYRMLDGMGMYDIIALMGTENARGGADIEAQLFPGAGGLAWEATVAGLNAPDRMATLFEEAFDRGAVTPEQVAEVDTFVASDVGRRLIRGEVAARRMFLDTAALDAATNIFRVAVQDEDPRLDILRRFNEVNGLVERNVSGALNLRFAFYRGLIDGGAFDHDVPEDLMLAEIWAQEPEVRHLTVEWLFSFQLIAYAEVSDADLEAYVALANSSSGRAVNSALFAAFDDMLAQLSYDLGAAAATVMVGEDA